MFTFLGTLWGRLAAGAVAVAAAVGAVLLWLAGVKRQAREAERARITAETQRRRIEDMEKANEVEDEVAGLDPAERRRRLQQWTRGRDDDR